MTRATDLQKWLRKNGPSTLNQIKDAGFLNFNPKTRTRMIEFGAIEKYQIDNPNAGDFNARVRITVYEATDKDYIDQRGGKPRAKMSGEKREAVAVAKAITVLRKRGYTVTPPQAPEPTEN